MTPLARRLRARIAAEGPIPVAAWMAACLEHYYGTRDPLGHGGDFITAPEISQVFGELLGLCLADAWQRAGSPSAVRLVELGPGRGTLMADLWRAVGAVPGFQTAATIHFVETSPALRIEQAQRVPMATWHARLDEVPEDAPLLLVANEFFDALPVRQLVRTADAWRERMVAVDGEALVFTTGGPPLDILVPLALQSAPLGSIHEQSPASTAIAAEIGVRLARHGGTALIVDYGYEGPALGDTLQAVRAHAYTDPLADAGEADLTGHVDFAALARAAKAIAHGPIGQGDFLSALGLHQRTERLAAKASPNQAHHLRTGAQRLSAPDGMGSLFRALALTGPGWPVPTGFAG